MWASTSRPWSRGEADDRIDSLESIPEDDAVFESGVWRRPGFHTRRSYRYRHACIRGYRGWVATSGCAAALLVVILIAMKNASPSQLVQQDLPSNVYDRPPSVEEDDATNSPPGLDYQSKHELIEFTLDPIWFNTQNGWKGRSYDDGDSFCKHISESRFVCPYEAYCPGGLGLPPFEGVQGDDGGKAAEFWSPVWNDQPLWVGVGTINTCVQKGALGASDINKNKFILCCRDVRAEPEPEPSTATAKSATQMVNEKINSKPLAPSVKEVTELTKNEKAAQALDPIWYGREAGYLGTTHQEAADFCRSMGEDRILCIPEAYCPNGSIAPGDFNHKPLFLKKEAFREEQWAPTSLNANSWILIGTIDGDPTTSCQAYESSHHGAQPIWGFDDSSTELKKHVMCCLASEEENPEYGMLWDESPSTP